MKKNTSIILKEEAAVVDDICYILEGKEMEIFIPNINIKHLKINIWDLFYFFRTKVGIPAYLRCE